MAPRNLPPGSAGIVSLAMTEDGNLFTWTAADGNVWAKAFYSGSLLHVMGRCSEGHLAQYEPVPYGQGPVRRIPMAALPSYQRLAKSSERRGLNVIFSTATPELDMDKHCKKLNRSPTANLLATMLDRALADDPIVPPSIRYAVIASTEANYLLVSSFGRDPHPMLTKPPMKLVAQGVEYPVIGWILENNVAFRAPDKVLQKFILNTGRRILYRFHNAEHGGTYEEDKDNDFDQDEALEEKKKAKKEKRARQKAAKQEAKTEAKQDQAWYEGID